MRMSQKMLDRFNAKGPAAPNPKGCWIWLGGLNSTGHPKLSVSGTYRSARRLAYEHFVGEIPDGKVLFAVECRDKLCVNPAHMEPMTFKEIELVRSFSSPNT